MANREILETVIDFIFLGSKITADDDCSHEIKRHLFLGRKLWPPRQHIKKQRHYFPYKGPSGQSYDFSSSHVWMWQLDYKESSVLKNWCFWTVMLQKTLESHLDSKEIKPVNLKEISPEYSLDRQMLKVKLQYFGHWCKEWTHWKRPWFWERLQEEKEMTENEMVG